MGISAGAQVMITSGFVGSVIGRQLLDRLPEHIFRVAFRIALTLIAIDIIRRAAGARSVL